MPMSAVLSGNKVLSISSGTLNCSTDSPSNRVVLMFMLETGAGSPLLASGIIAAAVAAGGGITLSDSLSHITSPCLLISQLPHRRRKREPVIEDASDIYI